MIFFRSLPQAGTQTFNLVTCLLLLCGKENFFLADRVVESVMCFRSVSFFRILFVSFASFLGTSEDVLIFCK